MNAAVSFLYNVLIFFYLACPLALLRTTEGHNNKGGTH